MTKQQNNQTHRFREIVKVLTRHEIVKGISPEKLRLILEDLGPTFVKVGQVMSLRTDFLPVEYCQELAKLRVEARPMTFDVVKSIVESEFASDINDVFSSFDENVLGSASIAQAHVAYLKDGTKVVIKVQRPNIYEIMKNDIQLLKKAAEIMRVATKIGKIIDFNMLLDEMWVTTQEEMDFIHEAKNCDELYENNKEIKYVTSPTVLRNYSTAKIMTMNCLDGIDITNIDELKAAGYDMKDISEKLCENYVKQILDDGFFHADPHPGNIRITDGKIAWLDLGMMGRLSNQDRKLFMQAVDALMSNDIGQIKDIVLAIATHTGEVNHTKLYEDIDVMIMKYAKANIVELDMAKISQEFLKLAEDNNLAMPKGFSMFTRGVMTIEGVVNIIDPTTNFTQILANHVRTQRTNEINVKNEILKWSKNLYNSADKMSILPGQVSELAKMTIKGQTKLNFELIDAKEPIKGLDNIANKYIHAIIMASLIIGSSIICTANIEPKVFGIPLISLIGFCFSLLIGGVLFIKIYWRKK